MSYLKKVVITNYKAFTEELNELEFAIPDKNNNGSGLTVIVGPNNSGKTTIINALKKFSVPSSNFVENEDYTPGKEPLIEIKDSEENNLFITRNEPLFSKKTEGKINIIQSNIVFVDFTRSWEDVFFAGERPFEDYKFRLQELEQEAKNKTDEYFGGLLTWIFSDNNKKKKFLSYLEKVFPGFSNWNLSQAQNFSGDLKCSYVNGNGLYHKISHIGDGYFKIFRLLACMTCASREDILFIDEPESSLHPQSQKALAELLFEFSKKRQVVIVTHSPYFIDWELIQNGARFVRMNKIDDKHCTIHALDNVFFNEKIAPLQNDWQKPHLLDLVSKELFFSNAIVFLEGQDDKSLIEKYIKENGIAKNYDIFGYGSGGAGNIQYFLAMAKQLGIKAAAIFDGDKGNVYEACKERFPDFKIMQLSTDDIRDKPEGKIPKIGLFDKSGQIKPQHSEEIDTILTDLREFFT